MRHATKSPCDKSQASLIEAGGVRATRAERGGRETLQRQTNSS